MQGREREAGAGEGLGYGTGETLELEDGGRKKGRIREDRQPEKRIQSGECG